MLMQKAVLTFTSRVTSIREKSKELILTIDVLMDLLLSITVRCLTSKLHEVN
jgi:hypothetical protein